MNDRTAERIRDRTDGIAGESAAAALLIVDMISTFEHPDGDVLRAHALECAVRIDELRQRARAENVPVIFVNDNYGQWRNDFQATFDAAAASRLGGEIARMLRPTDDDYHVLKPQRSGFFATPLEVLLSALKVSDLIVTGITTDMCVMFTAHDAYMRGYSVSVPSDCCAAVEKRHHETALATLERVADTSIRPAREIDFAKDTR
jgi:nicotinamidase-related amidase